MSALEDVEMYEKADGKVCARQLTGAVVAVIVASAVLVFLAVLGCYLRERYHQFLKEEQEEDDSPRKESAALAAPYRLHRQDKTQLRGHEPEVSPEPREDVGTIGRMRQLPPTAIPSIILKSSDILKKETPRVFLEKDAVAQMSTVDALPSSIYVESSGGSVGSVMPPPLHPELCACHDEDADDDPWIIPYQACRDLVLGTSPSCSITIHGAPQLYARLARCGYSRQIELGRTADLEVAEASVGPLPLTSADSLSAKIIGPGQKLYGYFVENGSGFAVNHIDPRNGIALTLDPVKTSTGSFLELAAHGQPVCLAKLNDPQGQGIEIDADPDVDVFLILLCVLACFAARPELLDDLP
jgi:hypothetical protein